MYGAISAGYKGVCEAADVEPLDAIFAVEASSKELDAGIRMIGIEVGNLRKLVEIASHHANSSYLFVEAFVEIVAVRILEFADVLLVGVRLAQMRNEWITSHVPLNRVTSACSFSTTARSCSISLLIIK